MPFFLLFIGILLVVVGAQGTQGKFFSLLVGDFTGPGNFVYWVVSIILIGSLGFVKTIRPLSDAFLILVLLVFVISNRGFFNQFNTAIKSGTATAPTTKSDPLNSGGLMNPAIFGTGSYAQ